LREEGDHISRQETRGEVVRAGGSPPGRDLKESDPEEILHAIARWVCSEPLRDLVAAFDGPALDADRLDAGYLERLLAFSAEKWDFRRGRERHAAFDPRYDGTERGDLILAAATALNMVNDTQPAGYAYDNVLILGSLLRNCLLRSSFTARLVREHNLVAGEIAALGSSRPLTGMEAAQLSRLRQRDYQLGEVSTEADALEAAVRHEFGLGQVIEQDCGGDDEHPGRSWRVRTYGLDGRRPLHVVSAPSGDGARRRANTADTYRFWAERVVRLQPMSTVLIVTSSIHVPFQAADALRVLALPWRCRIEVVGVYQGHPYDGMRGSVTASQYLQEINAALRSMRDLYQKVASNDGREH